MVNFKDSIDIQFKSHKGINIFNEEVVKTLAFTQETLDAIRNLKSLDPDHEESLIDYVTEKAIREFCRVNQYYSFTEKDHYALRLIYRQLVSELRSGSNSVENIAEEHYHKLTEWLKTSNPFAEKIYSIEKETVQPVVCAEYSPEFQLNILRINLSEIVEPFLDIGCGEQGALVTYLRNLGIDAFGFDRFASPLSYLMKCDWFTFPFEKDSWGTIVSNMSFTNHFLHHHLRNDGNFLAYSKKYMEILTSLKPGGSFHYAPGVSFIERFLVNTKFLSSSTTTEAGITTVKITKV